MDVVFEAIRSRRMSAGRYSFNPSSNGCGFRGVWKMVAEVDLLIKVDIEISFKEVLNSLFKTNQHVIIQKKVQQGAET